MAEVPLIPEVVRAAYSLPQVDLNFLGNHGGFSGAQLWRFHADSELRCLRRWPRTHPSESLLRWQHAVLDQSALLGLDFIHPPIRSNHNATFVAASQHLWQCEAWVPGRADYHQYPSDQRLVSAITALARFHNAVACQASDHRGSKSVRYKQEFLQRLRSGLAQQLADRSHRASGRQLDSQLTQLTRKILPKIEKKLSGFTDLMRPLAKQTTQPCFRDIWHDHVLFEGDELRGFIDFGSLNFDLPENDLARLLGSLARGDERQWLVGLEAYEQIRPLTQQMERRIRLLNEANWLLGGLQWATWIWLETRTFDSTQVQQRLCEIDYNVDKL